METRTTEPEMKVSGENKGRALTLPKFPHVANTEQQFKVDDDHCISLSSVYCTDNSHPLAPPMHTLLVCFGANNKVTGYLLSVYFSEDVSSLIRINVFCFYSQR